MTFMDFLRKTGILRFGAVSGTYTNAKDRPIELQEEGVFNAEKDLTTKKDVKKGATAAVVGGVPKWLFPVSCVCAVIVLFLALVSTVWWLLVAGWVVWFYLLRKTKTDSNLAGLPWTIIFVLLFVMSLVVGTATVKDDASTTGDNGNNSGTTQAEETYDCIAKNSDKPQQVGGYDADVFAAVNKDVAVGERRVPTKTMEFELSDFDLTGSKKPAETVYFTVYGSSGQLIPGLEIAIQVCNPSTSKTVAGGDVTNLSDSPTSDNTEGVEMSMSGVQTPKSTGTYNVDGIMRVNGGAWQLVDRLTVTFN